MKNVARTGASISPCAEDEACMPLVCNVCRKEIPSSSAVTFEGGDYAVHFCGLGCLETWKAHQWKGERPEQTKQ